MKKIYSNLILFITLIMFSPAIYAADDLRKRMEDWGKTFGTFGDLIMIIIGVAGVIMMILGGWGLKKYADDSRTNPLSKPLIFFIAGGILAGITFFQEMLAETLTGDGLDDNTGRDKFDAREVS